MKTISLFLLIALGSFEQTYGPFARPQSGAGHAIAAARSGALLVWNENDATGRARVHVGLIDANGTLISPVSVLPALVASRDARMPAVATDGESFFVAWEEVFNDEQTVGIAVGADGIPIGEPRALGAPTYTFDNVYEPTRVTWLGDSYAVRGDSNRPVRVDAAGNVLETFSGPVTMAVGADGSRAYAELRVISTPTGNFPGIPGFRTEYTIVWSAGAKVGSQFFGQQPVSAPVVAAAGNDFVMMWTAAGMVHYQLASTGLRYTHNAGVDASARPQLVCSATRCIAAYGTRANDVQGFTFDPANPFERAPFVAASSGRAESEPQVVMFSDSRGLISYRSAGNGETLAGRTIRFARPKHRAAR
ncbi:MAG TPA: hypothetical protein VND45_06700 [Thermoanaerobaculia bacterium]|nr:hypothetical protein [Thermoanaerobaculia bacterium]